MEEAVSTSILVCLCLIQRQNPVFLSNPSSWFSIPRESFSSCVCDTCVYVRVCPSHVIHTWSLSPSYLRWQGLNLSTVDKSATLQNISHIIGFFPPLLDLNRLWVLLTTTPSISHIPVSTSCELEQPGYCQVSTRCQHNELKLIPCLYWICFH